MPPFFIVCMPHTAALLGCVRDWALTHGLEWADMYDVAPASWNGSSSVPSGDDGGGGGGGGSSSRSTTTTTHTLAIALPVALGGAALLAVAGVGLLMLVRQRMRQVAKHGMAKRHDNESYEWVPGQALLCYALPAAKGLHT